VAEHRDSHGVEPICRVLEIAPSTYYSHAAREADPGARPDRWWRDRALEVEVRRVWDENRQVYGVRKVWKQLLRDGWQVARCTVERLMRQLGLRGVVRRQAGEDHAQRQGAAVSAEPGEPAVPGRATERAMSERLHLRLDLA